MANERPFPDLIQSVPILTFTDAQIRHVKTTRDYRESLKDILKITCTGAIYSSLPLVFAGLHLVSPNPARLNIDQTERPIISTNTFVSNQQVLMFNKPMPEASKARKVVGTIPAHQSFDCQIIEIQDRFSCVVRADTEIYRIIGYVDPSKLRNIDIP